MKLYSTNMEKTCNVLLLLCCLCTVFLLHSCSKEIEYTEDDPYNIQLKCLAIEGEKYHKTGQHEEAKKYFLLAYDKAKQRYGEKSPVCALALCNIASSEEHLGNYEEADKLYSQAIKLYTPYKKKGYIGYTTMCKDYASLCITMGNHAKANELLQEALTILRPHYHANPMLYTDALFTLGTSYCDLGLHDEAESIFKQCITTCKSSSPLFPNVDEEKREEIYTSALMNLCTLYIQKGEYDKAEEYVKLVDKKMSKTHDYKYAAFLTHLADIEVHKGELDKALAHYKTSLDILTTIKHHELITILLTRTGDCYSRLHNYSEAEKYYKKSLEYKKALYHNERNFPYSISLYSLGQLYGDMKLIDKAETYIREAYDIFQSEFVKYANSLSEEQMQERWIAIEQPFIFFTPRIVHDNKNEFPRLGALAYDNELFYKGILSTNHSEFSPMKWKDVRRQLDDNEVAIELMAIPYSNDSILLDAILLRKNSAYPQIISLGSLQEISKNTTRLIWTPILRYLHKGETIYIAPTQGLHIKPLEYYLYTKNTPMSEVFNIIRVTSTKNIARIKEEKRPNKAILYGGIKYNLSAKELSSASRNSKLSRELVDTLQRQGINYLKGTENEVNNILSTLLSGGIKNSKVLKGANATEESFKALSGKHYDIIHIATHGFYWEDAVASNMNYYKTHDFSSRSMGITQFKIDPLERCGLLFAGASLAMLGADKEVKNTAQDGVLTAKEIASMDLRGTDLLVLSACESGLGDITENGVHGLQEAFKKAGIQTIIMSLWKVEDEPTQYFMEDFYTNWIINKQSKREAFNNAQKSIRSKYSDPNIWGGFIMLD